MNKKFKKLACSFLMIGSIISVTGCAEKGTTYKIVFKNFDGYILSTIEVKENTVPVYKGSIPYRSSEGDLVYQFAGWNKELVPATEDTIYIAKFDGCYQINWLDEKGDTIEASFCKEGTIPECSTVINDRKEGAYYYEFDGWTPEVKEATEPAIYQATFVKYDRYYTVKWLNYDGTILEIDEKVERNSTPEFNGSNPTRANEGPIEYTFEGWNQDITPVKGDITYTAIYSDKRNTHKIDFKDSDNNLIKRYIVDHGETPFFDAELPNKNDGTDSFYIFKGWDKPISPAYEDTTYTATYSYEKSYLYNAINKLSTYKIVFKETENGTPAIAATYFQKYFKEITNITLPILTDSSVGSSENNQDFISFGKTKFATKFNFTYDENDEASRPDYTLVNDYHVVVVDGGKWGIVYGAVELLRQLFNFDYLEPTDFYFDKKLESSCVSNIAQKIYHPTIRYRQNYMAGLIRKNAMVSSMKDYGYGRACSSDTNLYVDMTINDVNVRNIHNALQLLPTGKYLKSHPEWYSSSGKQPCMSRILESDTACNLIVDVYQDIVKKYPTRYMVYSLCDVYATTTETACDCSKCEEYFHKYGNDSGVYMLLLNKLGDLIKERQNKGTMPKSVPGIMGTAYYSTHAAPTKNIEEVKAHDNVYMQVCPIFHNILRSYKECEKTYFDDWNNVTNGKVRNGFFYSLTDYSTGNYLLFHNDFDTMFDNLDVYKKAGLENIIQLGTLNASNDYNFANLRSYLYSYLFSNDNVTKEDFDNVTRSYFDKYFGPAADSMYQMFKKLCKSFDKFKYITTATHNDSWHNAFTRVSYGSIKTTKPVKDTNGNVYGIATNYDLLSTFDESKQIVLFSNNKNHEDYIGNYIDILNAAFESISSLPKTSEEYKLYYNRIILNSLVLYYVNLECFDDSSLMSKSEFMNFCSKNNVDRSGETVKIENLASHWGL